MQSDRPALSFGHVASAALRRALESEPTQLRGGELAQAVRRTLDALAADSMDEDVPTAVFAIREDAAGQAAQALRCRRRAECHSALRRFWGS